MKRFTSKTQKTGELGEDICVRYLENNGYKIIERNYTIRGGEIDIICKKLNKLHFIEVKSVSCETTEDISFNKIYNPAQNMTRSKIEKCQKTLLEYLSKNKVSCETQLDLYLIFIDKRDLQHKISRLENIF